MTDLKALVAEYARIIYDLGFICATGGNVSVRDPEGGGALITATGVSFRNVSPDDVVAVDLDGRLLEEGGLRASKETTMHLAAYRARPDVHAVLHAHPSYATAFACAHSTVPMAAARRASGALPRAVGSTNRRGSAHVGEVLPLLTVSARAKLRVVPVVPMALAGSKELADSVIAALSDQPEASAILLAEHGALTVGADLQEALETLELLEETAKVAWLARGLAMRGEE